jgi:hypothetical protein
MNYHLVALEKVGWLSPSNRHLEYGFGVHKYWPPAGHNQNRPARAFVRLCW